MVAVVIDRSLLRLMGPVVLGAAVLLAGCGDSEVAKAASARDAGIGGERFVQIGFDDIPRPKPVAVKDKKKVDRLETEEYEIEGVSAEGVIDYYERQLEAKGWTQVGEVEDTRVGLQGNWSQLGRTLIVVAKDEVPEEGKPKAVLVALTFSRLQRPGS